MPPLRILYCCDLRGFNDFQKYLISKEARRKEVSAKSITKDWVEKNGKRIRRKYCESICVFKDICEAKRSFIEKGGGPNLK